ncbi:Mobile element protein [Deinococcus marmoris]|uniref:Mobile element protein n=2 Tax=Deinococcus marmoris TaxID=249408 RepID=A0A1U7NR85_9DEIO|nr:Mobile element protein [Deinococcus marmoris]
MAVVTTAVRSGLLFPLFLLSIDASFQRKSGTKTQNIGSFWNGSTGRSERGTELSCCALINVQMRQVFPIHAQQTRPKKECRDRLVQYNDQLDAVLGELEHHPEILLRAVVADGQYAKDLFVETVTGHGFALISKLQRNANLNYVYDGPDQQRRGPKRKHDGKVTFADLSRFDVVNESAAERILTQVVWGVRWKRLLRVVVIQVLDHHGQVIKYAVLFSTDITMSASEVVALYRSRFEIEYVFRDGKQFLGLQDAQMRTQQALESHWNLTLLVMNLARLEALRANNGAQTLVFGVEDLKRRAYNALFAQVILVNLGLEARFEELIANPSGPLNFGLKAA